MICYVPHQLLKIGMAGGLPESYGDHSVCTLRTASFSVIFLQIFLLVSMENSKTIYSYFMAMQVMLSLGKMLRMSKIKTQY